jgi:threonine aldolase
MSERLAEDHDHAKLLALGLKEIGLGIDIEQVQTITERVDLSGIPVDTYYFAEKLSHEGIKVKPVEQRVIRMVTHKDISKEDIDTVLNLISKFLK